VPYPRRAFVFAARVGLVSLTSKGRINGMVVRTAKSKGRSLRLLPFFAASQSVYGCAGGGAGPFRGIGGGPPCGIAITLIVAAVNTPAFTLPSARIVSPT